jgi:hypothetical protein
MRWALLDKLNDRRRNNSFAHLTMTLRIASCSCGQLSARVSGDPIRVSVCHCFACQRRTGSVFGAQARFLRQAVEIAGTGTEYVRNGDEGGSTRFTFCATCGATVFFVTEGREDSIAIPVGAFSESRFPAPTYSVYEDRMHPWVTMPEDMEHMA